MPSLPQIRALNIGARVRVDGCAAAEDTGRATTAVLLRLVPSTGPFDAQHPLVNLILIPHMAASDHSVRVGVTGGTEESDATYGINTKEFLKLPLLQA